ncbi:MAG: phosphoribosylanthranilate isomerase [Sphingomonadales bacterium]|nr:phosphoribosylanthranilate isomerase [Sphingomonadales bacterium]
MKTQIKICGLSNVAAIDAAAEAGATHIGLVHFDKSPRHVGLEQAAALRMRTPPQLKVVLLLVNAEPELTQKALDMVRPDIVQFHGSETPEWLNLVRQHTKAHIWKALGLKNRETLINADRFDDVVERVLYDAPAQALPGGTGTRVDWSLLSQFDHHIPWGLAGGLAPDNVVEALRMTKAPLVDVSSGVESAPGVKDVDKIAQFCKAVRTYEHA